MNALAPLLLSFLLLYGYWALFLIVFIAALILPLPTNSLLLAAGAFASQGYFSAPMVLLVAMIANVAGDSIGFFLAQRYGRSAIHLLHLHVPSYIERLERYVLSYPGLTIFVTRFAGAADPLANVLAGFAGVPFRVFLVADILGNLVSIGGVIYAGYFLGIHWQDVINLVSVGDWMLAGVFVIVVIAIALWYRKRRYVHH